MKSKPPPPPTALLPTSRKKREKWGTQFSYDAEEVGHPPVLAFVVAAVLVKHAVRWRFGEGAWEAVGILLACVIGIALLYRRSPKRA